MVGMVVCMHLETDVQLKLAHLKHALKLLMSF